MSLFGEGLVKQASNNSVIIEFRLENIDDEFEKIKNFISDIVQVPTTMPWGNRSFPPMRSKNLAKTKEALNGALLL